MSLRGRASLPSFDWARVVRGVPGLVGVVEADGRIVAVAGRLFDEDPDVLELTHIWQLAAPAHQPRLRETLTRVAEQQTVGRTWVRSRRVDRMFAVELGPADAGQIVVTFTGTDTDNTEDTDFEELDPELLETPIAAERVSVPPTRLLTLPEPEPPEEPPPPPPTRPTGLDYVIVAPFGLRLLAGRLQRAIDLVTNRTAVWFDDEFDKKASRLTPRTRVLFLGPSKYADFIRHMVQPKFDKGGAVWGRVERKVLLWIHEDEGDDREVGRLLEAAVGRAAKVTLNRTLGASSDQDMPSGRELAGKLLLEPSPVRPTLNEERYLLAMAMFLLDGFEELHRQTSGS